MWKGELGLVADESSQSLHTIELWNLQRIFYFILCTVYYLLYWLVLIELNVIDTAADGLVSEMSIFLI